MTNTNDKTKTSSMKRIAKTLKTWVGFLGDAVTFVWVLLS